MNYRVVFSPTASDDLDNLLIYLSEQMGVRPARSYVGKIQRYCLDFAFFPKRGVARDDLKPGLRLVGYRRRATIAFYVHDQTVVIARVFHRGRQIDFTEDLDPESG